MENRISMSQRERDVVKVMSLVLKGDRTQSEAARLLGLCERQVRRIQRRMESEGDGGVVHRLRGRASNRQLSESFRREVLDVYRREFSDFGPTLASEELAKRALSVSSDTLRRWLIAEGLWSRKRRRDVHRSRRERRACFGELAQMDSSIHDWLEGRGTEVLVLTAMIDDATGKIVARFYDGETLEGHFDLLDRWLSKHGRPEALYTDHDSIFEAQSKGRRIQGTTQFSRALSELGIELILANSPQAKGRVERLFGTLQDRWVKALRLAGVTTRAEANALLDRELLPEFNRRFGKKPSSPNDAHRPLGPKHNPAAILSVQTTRTVANDYTVRFQNELYQVEKPVWPGLRGGKVIVEERLDGTLALRFQDRYLDHRSLGALPPNPRSLSHSQHPAVVGAETDRDEGSSSRSSAVTLTDGRSGCTPAEPCPPAGAEQATASGPYRPPADHPWRRSYLNTRK
jgi:hypothetical protein